MTGNCPRRIFFHNLNRESWGQVENHRNRLDSIVTRPNDHWESLGAVLDDQKLTNEEVKCFKEGTGNLIIISLWNGEKVLDLQRKVSIMKGRLKKHSNIRCHAYIYDVAIGSVRELAPSEILSVDSTDYLLGGSLIVKDGMLDRLLFDGGYAKATVINPTQYRFAFYYYNRDHLGNIREVVDTAGVVRQVTNYYPFGTPYSDASAVLNASFQPYKFGGKELDRMHGLDTYDFGARQYNPVTARWDRMDPQQAKEYSWTKASNMYKQSQYMYAIKSMNKVSEKLTEIDKNIYYQQLSKTFSGASYNVSENMVSGYLGIQITIKGNLNKRKNK